MTVIDSAYVNYSLVKEQNSIGEFVDRRVVQLFTDSKIDSKTPQYLKWDLDEAFQLSPTDFPDPFGSIPPPCYITSLLNPSEIHLYNSNLLEADNIKGLKLTTRILDYAFLDRFYFNIKLSSITPEAYNYWEKVSKVVNNIGTVFDSPPAPIRGNIYNVNDPDEQVLGYFSASSIKISRKRILAVEVPYFIPLVCEYRVNKEITLICAWIV